MANKLYNASMKFHLACVVKLKEKEKEGWIGWDNPHWKEAFKKRIKDLPQFELTQNNLVKIANYCNFLWNLIGAEKEVKEINE